MKDTYVKAILVDTENFMSTEIDINADDLMADIYSTLGKEKPKTGYIPIIVGEDGVLRHAGDQIELVPTPDDTITLDNDAILIGIEDCEIASLDHTFVNNVYFNKGKMHVRFVKTGKRKIMIFTNKDLKEIKRSDRPIDVEVEGEDGITEIVSLISEELFDSIQHGTPRPKAEILVPKLKLY